MTTEIYGIATRDEQGLHLIARVARRSSGIYYLIPRANEDFDIEADANWDPHASYHTDGWHHFKSFNQVVAARTKRQPLDNFRGAEPLFDQSFMPGDLTHMPRFTGKMAFAQVLEIPVDLLNETDSYAISANLLSPGASRIPGPWLTPVLEFSVRDAVPWVHITLWRGLVGVAP
jgi:hypothetical protein